MSRATDRAPRYPIRAVSKLTGIGIDTLRAWERRYRAVTPARDDRGRLYSDADVARLRLLRQAVAGGHSVGRIARLPDGELRELAAMAGRAAPGGEATEGGTPASRATGALDGAAFADALARLDGAAIDQEFSRLAAVLTPIGLVRDVLLPSLAKVAEDCQGRAGGIAREHLVSSTLRHLLGSFLRLYAHRGAATRLLFATLAGDRHEIGTLGAAMIAASGGLGVAYLGPDLPAREIVDAAKAAGAHVLVLGLTTARRGAGQDQELRALLRELPPDVELWVGGRAAPRLAALIGRRGRVVSDFDAYQAQLARLGARLA